MIAQDEGNKHVLLALGKRLPKKWAAAEAREEARAVGGVDFNAESVLEESEDCDEVRWSVTTHTTRTSPTRTLCRLSARRYRIRGRAGDGGIRRV